MPDNAVVETKSQFDELSFNFDEPLTDVTEDITNLKIDLPSEPYARVSRKPFETTLRIVAAISKTNLDVISKSIFIKTSGKQMQISCTDKDIYFNCSIPIENDENVMNDNMILDSRQLIEVAKNSSDVILYRMNGSPYVNLLGGFYPLEQFNFDTQLYSLKDPDNAVHPSGSAHASFPITELHEELNVMLNIVALAGRVEDKKMVIKDGLAYGSFITTVIRMKSKLPDMVLRSRDIEILRGICMLFSKDVVNVYVGPDRNTFWSDNFSYSSTQTQGKLSLDHINAFSEPTEEGGIYLNGKQIYQILNFLDSPVMKMTAVSLLSSKEGVYLKTQSRKEKSCQFRISPDPSAEFSSDIQVNLAKGVFGVLQSQPSITLVKKDRFLKVLSDISAIISTK